MLKQLNLRGIRSRRVFFSFRLVWAYLLILTFCHKLWKAKTFWLMSFLVWTYFLNGTAAMVLHGKMILGKIMNTVSRSIWKRKLGLELGNYIVSLPHLLLILERKRKQLVFLGILLGSNNPQILPNRKDVLTLVDQIQCLHLKGTSPHPRVRTHGHSDT